VFGKNQRNSFFHKRGFAEATVGNKAVLGPAAGRSSGWKIKRLEDQPAGRSSGWKIKRLGD
jgi:hypothetical protein